MIKPRYLCRMALCTFGLLLCIGGTAAGAPRSQYGPATLELKRLVAANPELKRLLITSIEQAKQINPDRLPIPRSRSSNTSSSLDGPSEPSRRTCLRPNRMRLCISASTRASPISTSLPIYR